MLLAGEKVGAAVIEQIKKTLNTEGELIARDRVLTLETLTGLGGYFFEKTETPSIQDIRSNFSCIRNWPILEDLSQLDGLLREGVKRGKWSLFRMAGMASTKPEAFFCNETGAVPLDVNLGEDGWTLVQPHGAKQRGWWPTKIDAKKIETAVTEVVAPKGAVSLEILVDHVCKAYGDVPPETIISAAEGMIKKGVFGSFTGSQDQDDKPDDLLMGASQGSSFILKPGQVVVTPAHAATKGWKMAPPPDHTIKISGNEAAEKIHFLLDRMGGIYNKGATSSIDLMELMALDIPGGGKLSITMENVTPEAMKNLDEFFETLKLVSKVGQGTDGYLEITQPDEACLLVKQLK